jgi:hypothetical protein
MHLFPAFLYLFFILSLFFHALVFSIELFHQFQLLYLLRAWSNCLTDPCVHRVHLALVIHQVELLLDGWESVAQMLDDSLGSTAVYSFVAINKDGEFFSRELA